MVTQSEAMASRVTRPMSQVEEEPSETEGLLSMSPGAENEVKGRPRPNEKRHFLDGTTSSTLADDNDNVFSPLDQHFIKPESTSTVKRPSNLSIPTPRKKVFTVTNYGNVSGLNISAASPSSPVESSRPSSPTRSIILDIDNVPPKPKTRVVSVMEHDDGTVPEIRVEDVPEDDNTDAVWTRLSNSDEHHLRVPSIPEVVTNGHVPHSAESYTYHAGVVTQDFRFPEKYNCSITKGYKAAADIAKLGRLYASRKVDRLVNKDGHLNITYKNIKTKHSRYMADIFTTMLDFRWRYTLLIFTLGFVLSWVLFALFWYGAAMTNRSGEPCVDGVTDFHSAVLFSIETQHTIGYGTRAANVNCPTTTILLMLQSIFGVIVQCVMAGIVFAKLARPKHRAHTIIFSKQAVICQEDGQYCLQFRVGDMRRSKLIGGVIHAMLIKKHVTKEGDVIPLQHFQLDIRTVTSSFMEDHDQHIFLAWPVRIVHKINEKSPLFGMNRVDLLKENFEIIVILEGVVESTGGTTQVRTSYLPSEILWGHRLDSLLTYVKQSGSYQIDYSHFHQTVVCDMPDDSAKEHVLSLNPQFTLTAV